MTGVSVQRTVQLGTDGEKTEQRDGHRTADSQPAESWSGFRLGGRRREGHGINRHHYARDVK